MYVSRPCAQEVKHDLRVIILLFFFLLPMGLRTYSAADDNYPSEGTDVCLWVLCTDLL